MGSHQDEDSSLRVSQRAWYLILIPLCIIPTLLILMTSFNFEVLPSRHSTYVHELNAIINAHKAHLDLRDAEHRQNIRGLFGIGDKGSDDNSTKSSSGGLLASIENAIGGAVTADLAAPAMSLGVGLANGTVMGLNLTMPSSMVSMMGQATGLSLLAQNLGSGLTSTLLSAVNISSLLATDPNEVGGTLGGADGTVGQAVLALAQGLGGGTSTGLGLKSAAANQTFFNTTGVSGIAGNFGVGLTNTLLSSINISSLTSGLSAGSDQAGGMFGGSSGMVGQAVLALAQGLGGGAAQSLNLSSSKAATFNTTGITGVVGNFGQGLSSSVLGSVDISRVTSGLTSSLKKRAVLHKRDFNISSLDIPGIAAGVGTGLGQGAAIGLGLQTNAATSTNGTDTAAIAESFTQNLVSSFLGNGTVSKIFAFAKSTLATANSSLSSLNVEKVAEGFAVGLVSGVGSKITSLMVVNGNTSSFDDSVGGASNGFGFGLGSSGATLVQELLGKSSKTSSSTKRAVQEVSSRKNKRRVVAKRQDATSVAQTSNITDLAGVLANLNSSMINPLLQTGVNDLTCTGMGGLVGVVLGLSESGTLKTKMLQSLSSSSNISLPDQVFNFTSNGNTYAVNLAKGTSSVLVNGMGVTKTIVLIALHVIIAIMVYFNTIPLIMLYHSTQKVTTLARGRTPTSPSPTPKWVTINLYTVPPFSILLFGLGIAARGTGKFNTAHGILGLLLFLITLLASATTYLQSRPTNTPLHNTIHKSTIAALLLFSLLTLFTGLVDLSNLSICIVQQILTPVSWVMFGFSTLGPLVLAVGLEGVLWLVGRTIRKEGGAVIGGMKVSIGRPQLVGRKEGV